LSVKFEVKYMNHGNTFFQERPNWKSVLNLIKILDENGLGYVESIDYEGNTYYHRVLNHKNGTDYWVNHLGEEVNLAEEHWNTV
jgi:hypothetical protein